MEIHKIYLDMDGVLADFEGGIKKFCHMDAINQDLPDSSEEEQMWAGVRDAVHFYDMLDVLPGAKAMFDAIYSRYGGACEILTGIPRPYRGVVNAETDKISWAHRLFSEDIKVNVVLRDDKVNFVTGKGDILIDDYHANIEDWENYGGTGILHTDPQETLRQMKMIEEA